MNTIPRLCMLMLVGLPSLGMAATLSVPGQPAQKSAVLELQKETAPVLAPELGAVLDKLHQLNTPLLNYVPKDIKEKPLFEGQLFNEGSISAVKTRVYLVNGEQTRYALNFEGDGLLSFSSSLPLKTEPGMQSTKKNIKSVGYTLLNARAKNHILGHVINLPRSGEANFVTITRDVIVLSIKDDVPKDLIQVSKKNKIR